LGLVKFDRLTGPDFVCYSIEVCGLRWDTYDWSLAWRQNPAPDKLRVYTTFFALRCATCRRFVIGCDEHWFCGLCTMCKKDVDLEFQDA
jgi:hypothetical protein